MPFLIKQNIETTQLDFIEENCFEMLNFSLNQIRGKCEIRGRLPKDNCKLFYVLLLKTCYFITKWRPFKSLC